MFPASDALHGLDGFSEASAVNYLKLWPVQLMKDNETAKQDLQGWSRCAAEGGLEVASLEEAGGHCTPPLISLGCLLVLQGTLLALMFLL
jgi:hypothetical protein